MSVNVNSLNEVVRYTDIPGSLILLQDAINVKVPETIDICCSGTRVKPIVIKPEHPKCFAITGTTIEITGSFVSLVGWTFHGSTIKIKGDGVRICDCKFDSSCLLVIDGLNNRIDHGTIAHITCYGKDNIVDHNVLVGNILINNDNNVMYKNKVTNTIITIQGSDSSLLHNTFHNSLTRIAINKADRCIVFSNRFRCRDGIVNIINSSDTLVANNTFNGILCPIVMKDSVARVCDNKFVACGSNVFGVENDEGIMTKSTTTSAPSVIFTNNIVYNEKHCHEFPIHLGIHYSSNVCITRNGLNTHINGIIHHDVLSNDLDSITQDGKDHGHNHDHCGALTLRHTIHSTQLFKDVREYNNDLKEPIRKQYPTFIVHSK